MKLSPVERRVWLAAALSGVLGVAVVLALFRGARPPQRYSISPAKAPAADSIGLARLNEADAKSRLRDEAMLRDPTPLFLPTQYNAGENALPPGARQEPGSAFQDYPAKLNFSPTELQLNLPAPVAVPARVADAFASDKPKRPFLGIGQTDRTEQPLPVRAAYVKVADVGDGSLVIAEPVAEAHFAPDTNWQPMEFLVAIDPAGLVRPAMLVTSSQVAVVDAYFRDFLGNGLNIGERLAPGFYRVSIGP